MVTFNPYMAYQKSNGAFGGNVLGPEVVSTFQQPYSNSMVMDLKDGNVFEFTAPYQCPMPYLNFTSASGGISIVCIDPLQATGTVATVVPLLVEVCADSDYELADYAGPYFPIHPSGTIYTQSQDLVKPTIISDISQVTMGEKFSSVKQMISMPSTQVSVVTANNTTTRQYIPPWFVNVDYFGTSTSTGSPNTLNQTFYSNVGGAILKCYAFCKGGTDVHLYPYGSPEVSARVYQFPQEGTGTASAFTPTLASRQFPSAVPFVRNTGGLPLHVRIPSHQTVVRIPTTSLDTCFVTQYPGVISASPMVVSHFSAFKLKNESSADKSFEINRCAADDAALAHYMGPVPLWIPNSLSTLPLDSAGSDY